MALFAAVKSGDCARVALCLETELICGDFAFDRYTNGHGESVLVVALCSRFFEIAEMLLAASSAAHEESNSLSWALSVACRVGHYGIAQALLSRSVASSSTDIGIDEALWHAASNGHAPVVELLLAAGADVDYNNNIYSQRVLVGAIKNGHVLIVKMLLAAGVKVNVPDRDGRQALRIAATSSRASMIDILVDAGAEIDAADHNGMTALAFAAREGKADSVKILLNYGAAVSLSALVHAACQGFEDIVDMLLDVDAQATDAKVDGSLQRVARRIQTALAEGSAFNVNSCIDSHAQPVIFEAVQNGLVDVVAMLLDIGADIEARHRYSSFTPLMLAANEGHVAIAELLISRGAKVGVITNRGDTLLMLASAAGHTRIVEMILELARYTARFTYLRSPYIRHGAALILAAQYGHANVVDLLLDADADIGQREAALRALSHATRNGFSGIATKLLVRGALVNSSTPGQSSALVHASHRGDLDMVNALLAVGADVNHPHDKKRTALVAATANNQDAVVDRLLAAGADIENSNALVTAVKYGNEHLVDKLLAAGMSPESRRAKYPPLYYAALKSNLAFVEKLLAAGANVGRKDGKEDPALMAAFRTGNIEIVHLLLDAGALNEGSLVVTPFLAVCNAATYDHAELFELLVSRGVDLSGLLAFLLHTASSFGSLGVVRFLLAHGCEVADVNAALREAARTGHANVVEELLLHGGDLTDTNEKGENALHKAAVSQRGKAVLGFLRSGEVVDRHAIDVNARTRYYYNRTPLEYTKRHRCRESMAALVEMGADVDVKRDYAWHDWMRALSSLNLPGVPPFYEW